MRYKQTEMLHQIVLPVEYHETVLTMAHLALWAVHYRRNKTTLHILKRFFWPSIRRDVADLCKRCQTCQTKSIPYLLFAFRELPLSTIRHTPFELI